MAMGRGSISLAQLKTQEQFVRHTSRRAGDSSLPAQSFPFHTLSYILIRSSPYYWISLVLRQQSVCLKCWRSGFDPWVQKIPWRRKWQPTPVPLLGESHRGGAWWATVHEVAKSWTQLSDFTHSLTQSINKIANFPLYLLTVLVLSETVFLKKPKYIISTCKKKD